MSDRWEPQALNYSHEALIRQIMANPTASNAELGLVFGRSSQWVSLVKSSGLFKEQYAQLAGSLIDPLVAATIEQRLEMVTSRSLEVLMEKLARPTKDISDDLVMAAATFGAKAQGIGGFSSKPAPAPPAPPSDRLERLEERLLRMGQPRNPQEITDVQVNDVSQAGETRPAGVPSNHDAANPPALQHGVAQG